MHRFNREYTTKCKGKNKNLTHKSFSDACTDLCIGMLYAQICAHFVMAVVTIVMEFWSHGWNVRNLKSIYNFSMWVRENTVGN